MKSKLQKPDQDILEAYMMVDEVVGNIKSVRKNIDSDFQVWYKQILDFAEKLGIDSLIIQMQDQFSDEDRHTRHLLYLVPSIIVNNTLELSEATEGMLFWENDLPFPKSLGNELRRWQVMWQSAEKELPSNLLFALGACDEDAFPNIHRLLLITCTLPINSAEAERSFRT